LSAVNSGIFQHRNRLSTETVINMIDDDTLCYHKFCGSNTAISPMCVYLCQNTYFPQMGGGNPPRTKNIFVRVLRTKISKDQMGENESAEKHVCNQQTYSNMSVNFQLHSENYLCVINENLFNLNK